MLGSSLQLPCFLILGLSSGTLPLTHGIKSQIITMTLTFPGLLLLVWLYLYQCLAWPFTVLSLSSFPRPLHAFKTSLIWETFLLTNLGASSRYTALTSYEPELLCADPEEILLEKFCLSEADIFLITANSSFPAF